MRTLDYSHCQKDVLLTSGFDHRVQVVGRFVPRRLRQASLVPPGTRRLGIRLALDSLAFDSLAFDSLAFDALYLNGPLIWRC